MKRQQSSRKAVTGWEVEYFHSQLMLRTVQRFHAGVLLDCRCQMLQQSSKINKNSRQPRFTRDSFFHSQFNFKHKRVMLSKVWNKSAEIKTLIPPPPPSRITNNKSCIKEIVRLAWCIFEDIGNRKKI